MIRENAPPLKKYNRRRAAQSLLHVTLFRHGVSYKSQSDQSCGLFKHALSPFRSAWLVALPFRSRHEVHCVSSCCIFQQCFWDRHRSLFECNKIPRSLVSDTLEKDGKVGVLNSERLRTPTGEGKNITGYAYIPDPNQPGKLKVHLGGVPVDAPYWVVKLGPPTFGEGLYQYSVVTDNLQITLFVLARDVDTFKSQYDEEVRNWLTENGFTRFYNKPVATLQNKECIYVAERPSSHQTVEEFLRYD
ncbi:unnamed protein product [Pocillopora meandrina]|uniref:Lipocalin/cytosolic fatty-acid binding domain-containing protein n=1 Tax=Pocillopora meandrina TaxID=46732 RepID=A0AAU9XF72_9CNID|nr:unnamed protein product [Pocillopora meandrina]